MMLHGQKGGVQDNAQRNGQLEERITHHLVETVLKLQPALVIRAAVHATIAIPIGQVICKVQKLEYILEL